MGYYQKHAALLFQRVKIKKESLSQVALLADGQLSALDAELNTDAKRLTFWINVYNSYFLLLRRDQGIQRPAIYRARIITIAGQKFSLDDIEHGILRRFRAKVSLGYLPNPFVRKHLKKLAVDQLDPRIHFALNCGAKSCPPIYFYKLAHIDKQLDIAQRSFITAETELDHGKKKMTVSKLFLWYQGDFGGKAGVKRLIQKVCKKNMANYSLSYAMYDWDEDLDNWA